MPKQTEFVLDLFVSPPEPPTSQAARDREAAEYWARLTPEQEGWVARKMHFHQFGASTARKP